MSDPDWSTLRAPIYSRSGASGVIRELLDHRIDVQIGDLVKVIFEGRVDPQLSDALRVVTGIPEPEWYNLDSRRITTRPVGSPHGGKAQYEVKALAFVHRASSLDTDAGR